MKSNNLYLLLAAFGCFSAALAHIGVIIGGADWYRTFGAGEELAQMAAAGDSYPALLTAGIAGLLTVWGLYALSGAGVLRRLPLLKPALMLITLIFCTRGLGGLVLPWVSQEAYVQDMGVSFWLISSGICLLLGVLYGLGWWKLQLLRKQSAVVKK